MMWHFYEIPYIPDLELVKYQSLGEQGIDGILERHNRFLRQWQRNTVLIHTTLHFFLSYTHERPKGSRLQIFLAFSSDQTVNFESIDALMQASPLADYYKIAPIEDVPVCLRKSFTNILLVKKQEQTRLSTGDACFIGGANPYIGCERWLKKAAEQNYIYAEELLADKYYEGAYIVKDVKAAIYWYEKAANQGSVYAMYQAGYVYYTVPIDYNKAGQWFSLAAEKGNKDAEDVLRNHLRYNRFTKKWDAIR